MVFSSVIFLFRFLPLFLICYFVTPAKYRNIALFIGSLIFYAYGEPVYVLLMMFSIVINDRLARVMAAKNESREGSGKPILILLMFIDFGLLFFFKYLNFTFSIVNSIAGKLLFNDINLTLPLGISFYTFQIASYVIDVYRGKYKISESFTDFATYVCMFPQLIAGPIVNFGEVRERLHKRKVNYAMIEWGVCVFIMGLSYKVLLANKIVSLWNKVQTAGVTGVGPLTAWLGSWGFSMQIYFDFFGYSLMAIGLGKILGFNFPANFLNPYTVKSATSFWRYWHMTLGRWFRDYVYIPLGGNRKGTARLILNTFIVWFLTGLWHGANWNFIIWGLFFFVILMLEKLLFLEKLEKTKVLGHIYMFFMIPFSWTIFNITDLNTLVMYIKRLLFLPVEGSLEINWFTQFWEYFSEYWWLLAICAFCCTGLPMKFLKRFYNNIFVKMLLLALFWYSVYQLLTGANNPFLYFRF